MATRGPPKKKAKKTKTAESSIVPLEDDALTASMSFPPPSKSLEITSKPKKKDKSPILVMDHQKAWRLHARKRGENGNSSSGASKRPRSGSNQPEPLSIELPPMLNGPPVKQKTKRKEPTTKHTAIPWRHLTALQWAQEAKGWILVALQ